MSNLTEAINKLVEEKTFSLDALEAIRGLRDKAEAMERENNLLKVQVADLRADHDGLKAENAALTSDLTVFKSREASIRAKEIEAYDAKAEAKRQQAIADTFREAMGMIFKPNTVREQVQRNIPVASPGSNGSAGYVSNYPESSVVERTEG